MRRAPHLAQDELSAKHTHVCTHISALTHNLSHKKSCSHVCLQGLCACSRSHVLMCVFRILVRVPEVMFSCLGSGLMCVFQKSCSYVCLLGLCACCQCHVLMFVFTIYVRVPEVMFSCLSSGFTCVFQKLYSRVCLQDLCACFQCRCSHVCLQD